MTYFHKFASCRMRSNCITPTMVGRSDEEFVSDFKSVVTDSFRNRFGSGKFDLCGQLRC